ncbi:MAG: ATP-binding protein [Acidobacteriota bacterium]|jgi:predicted kinase|nr:ATP-binding protein [Acidobacteriota bacterium]
MIVLMAGLPASGKSTLCRALESRLGGTVLDKDVVRASLFSKRDIEYSTAQDDFCVKIMLEAAAFTLRKHSERIIFLDGRPFSRRYQIDQVIQAAELLNQPWRILECICSNETARNRLAEQAASGLHLAGNRDYELYERVKNDFEEITLPKTVIDTDQPLEACIARASTALQN